MGERVWVVSANGALIDVRGHYRKRVAHRGEELPPPL
jgi:hypothetical protein